MKQSAILATLLYVAVASNASASLIAEYKFSGNANDTSGNGHNGFITAATLTTDRFGSTDSAYAFNGTDAYIEVLDSDDLRLNNTDFSFRAWVLEIERNISFQDAIITKRGTGNENGWFFSITGSAGPGGGGNAYYQASGGVDPSALSTSNVTLNIWHHIALTYNSASEDLRFFIDGIFDSSTATLPTPNSSTEANLFIGRDSSGQRYFFHGKLDDIGIYNNVLSDSEIRHLAGISSIPIPQSASLFAIGLLGLSFARKTFRRSSALLSPC